MRHPVVLRIRDVSERPLKQRERNVKTASRDRTDLRTNNKIAMRLEALRRELLADYTQCSTELRSARNADWDDEDAAECCSTSSAYLLQHLLTEIRDVEDALERLQEGRYGICMDCGSSIGAGRLRAIPTARRCMNCQARSERRAG